MTKEELKRELADVQTLYFVGNERWTRFDVYYVKGGELVRLWINYDEPDVPRMWVKLHYTRSGNYVGGYFETHVVGSDRTYEIMMAIGEWLYGDPYRFKAVNLYFAG